MTLRVIGHTAKDRRVAVLDLLRQQPMTVRQLADALKSEVPLIRTAIRSLLKYDEIVALNESNGHHAVFYDIKFRRLIDTEVPHDRS